VLQHPSSAVPLAWIVHPVAAVPMELAREKTGGLEGVRLMLAVGEKVGGATVRAANKDARNRELLFQ
jgi:hypothetical protein